MKKIQYKVIKTLLLAVLVGGLTNIVLADPPATPDGKKTREKAATTTTTHTETHTATAAATHADRPKPADAPQRPEQHDEHVTHDVGHPDDHARHDNDRPDDHFVHDGGHRDVHYEHDNRGWYDEDHHRHDFVVYRGHRGYWNYENGQPVFVFIDGGGPLPFSINIHL